MLTGICWEETFQRHQQFALYLKKNGYEVIFAERIPSSRFSISKLIHVLRSRRKSYKRTENNNYDNILLVNYHFLNPENGMFKLVNKFKVEKFINENGTDYDIVINYLPINTTRMIIEKLNYRYLIYDCVRNFEEFGGYRKDIIEEEKYIVSISDKVFTDSFYLTNKMMKIKSSVIQFLPIANSDWIKGCIPKKLKSINDIAYFGTVRDEYLNVEILKELSLSGFNIHIWGIVSTKVSFNFINHGFESVLESLARQITTTCDAIILPYSGNVDGVIPAKLVQSLCTCLPVFCTKFYDSVVLEDYLYLFDNAEQLKKMIRHFDYKYFYEYKLEIIKKFVEPLNEFEQKAKFMNELNDKIVC